MRKILNKLKIFGALTMLISIIVTSELLMTKSLSATPVTLSFVPAPNIDVVLAKGKTTTDVTSFKNDLLSSLAELGIDTTKVKISSVSTENVNMESSFAWNKDLSNSIGSISISNNGQSVTMVGNRTNPGKNAIYIVPSGNQEQKFTFNYNINYGDSFNAAGMLLKVSKVGNTLTGYMLSFNKTSATYYRASGSQLGAIWKFNWTIGTNSSALSCLAQGSTLTANSCVLVKGLSINQSGQLTVSVENGYISISGGGLATDETISTESSYDGIGFGFFSDHYSHGCDSIGSFALTNINLQKTTVKKLSEVLREPEWRNDAIKITVNVSDYENTELKNNSTMGELLTRLINENIYYVAWGKDANQSQYEDLISANNGNGIYIKNTDYTNSISQTAQYIKTLIDQLNGNDNYLILGEPIKISSNPEGILVNTSDASYPYGRWKIMHDYKYFENNIGQFDRANQYLNNMITEFDKTGEFNITYEDQEIVPKSVYVHRRPIAIINHSKIDTTINLSSASYDLDSYSITTDGIPYGIVEEEWMYKKATETTWNKGKLTTLEANTDYIIQLRVKDLQGAWSKPASIYTTNDSSVLPIAQFDIESNKIYKKEILKLKDTSYDPYGGTIKSWKWEIYKDETMIKSSTSETPQFSDFSSTGVYKIVLEVTNDRNLKSEIYSRTFEVIDDISAPSITINPENGGWAKEINVNVDFNDSQSGFKSYQYAITDSQVPATTGWSNEITKSSDTINIDASGNKYLHIKATDNEGNVSDERITGIYKIDRTAPSINYVQDTNTKFINSMTMKISATDSQSGIKSFTINGTTINTGSVTFIKNGTYTAVATDNVGWQTTKEIVVNNIYYNCKAGLRHPDFSSTYDSCPICESYSGLTVTNTSNVYDANNHRVQYNNPKAATIVEYYNESETTLPNKVGNYSYELKVVYNGNEYKTGIAGTYSVTKKIITIKGITSLDKIYDGNDSMTITNGELVDVCVGDVVGFTLPSVVYAENKNIGNHKIRLESDIILTGQDAYNYTLTQPIYGSITGNIEKRTIMVSEIQGKTRKYNKTDVVEIIGGTIVNGVEGDDISLIIPKTGIAESENTGNWKIKMDDIVLQGTDANNYTLIQPEEVRGTIEKADGEIKIGCEGKKFDREKIEPFVIENNSGGNVTFKYYITGTSTQVEKPSEIGKYDIIATLEETDNYTSCASKRLTVEITNPDSPNLKVESVINALNGTEIEEIKEVNVHYTDTIKVKIKVKNIGVGSGYLSKVSTIIPKEMELVKDSEINKKYKWTEVDGKLETTMFSFKENFESELYSKEQDDKNQLIELELELKVVIKDRESADMILPFEIEQQNKHGDIVEYDETSKENSKDEVNAQLKYFDVSIDKTITMLSLTYAESGKTEDFNIYQRKGSPIKMELTEMRANSSYAKIKYKITLVNNGTSEGIIDKVIDVVPKGTIFEQEDNPDWTLDNDGNAIYNKKITLSEKQMKEIEIVLKWDLRNYNLGNRRNQVFFDAPREIDQILTNEEKDTLKNTDNFAYSEMIFSLRTGSENIIYVLIGIIIVTTLGIGIVLIKKYVTK